MQIAVVFTSCLRITYPLLLSAIVQKLNGLLHQITCLHNVVRKHLHQVIHTYIWYNNLRACTNGIILSAAYLIFSLPSASSLYYIDIQFFLLVLQINLPDITASIIIYSLSNSCIKFTDTISLTHAGARL